MEIRMNSKRLYYTCSGLLVLLSIGSIASAYFGYNTLVAKSKTLTGLKVTSSSFEEQERSLIKAKSDISEYRQLQQVAESIVPQEKDQARTVRELVALAEASNIKISGLSFPTSTLGSEKSTTTGPTQLKKVEGIPGLSQLEITVSSDTAARFETIIDFLARLENNRRTSAISSISITPEQDSGLLKFNFSVQVYIKQ